MATTGEGLEDLIEIPRYDEYNNEIKKYGIPTTMKFKAKSIDTFISKNKRRWTNRTIEEIQTVYICHTGSTVSRRKVMIGKGKDGLVFKMKIKDSTGGFVNVAIKQLKIASSVKAKSIEKQCADRKIVLQKLRSGN